MSQTNELEIMERIALDLEGVEESLCDCKISSKLFNLKSSEICNPNNILNSS